MWHCCILKRWSLLYQMHLHGALAVVEVEVEMEVEEARRLRQSAVEGSSSTGAQAVEVAAWKVAVATSACGECMGPRRLVRKIW